jgi:hypothetical protein
MLLQSFPSRHSFLAKPTSSLSGLASRFIEASVGRSRRSSSHDRIRKQFRAQINSAWAGSWCLAQHQVHGLAVALRVDAIRTSLTRGVQRACHVFNIISFSRSCTSQNMYALHASHARTQSLNVCTWCHARPAKASHTNHAC